MKYRILLASGSPRRKEILQNIGVTFVVRCSECDESCDAHNPADLVSELSRRKAETVLDSVTEPTIIIGADTVVACDNEILTKPSSEEVAKQMLRKLSGRTHEVLTGVTLLIYNGSAHDLAKRITFSKRSFVRVYEMSDAQIEDYVRRGESLDKAGAYAIQGFFAPFIEGIEGDYLNIVGLPVAEIYWRLQEEGINLITGEIE